MGLGLPSLDELDGASEPSPAPSEKSQPSTKAGKLPRSSVSSDRSESDTPSPPTVTSTELKGSGDPNEVAKALGGLLIIVTGSLAALLARRTHGRATLRQPTPDQRDDIAEPVSRILCRHLPMAKLGPDLGDIGMAAGATHSYVLDGALIKRVNVPQGENVNQGEQS